MPCALSVVVLVMLTVMLGSFQTQCTEAYYHAVFVSQFPELYNTSLHLYRDLGRKALSWKHVSNQVGESVKDSSQFTTEANMSCSPS